MKLPAFHNFVNPLVLTHPGCAALMLLLALPGTPLASADANTCRLANDRLIIAFSPEHGDLVEFTDAHTRQNFAGTMPSGAPLWELTLAPANQTLTASSAQSFRAQPLDRKPSGLRLTWEKFGLPAAPELRVEAVVRLDAGQPMSHWELAVSGLNELSLTHARFPRIIDIPRQANERLAVPAWMGYLTTEPRQVFAGPAGNGRRFQWSYPGHLSLQCLAFYQQDGPGLYVACNDTAGFNKDFAFFGDRENRLHCEIAHLPERRPAAAPAWRLPYAVQLGTFTGDWFTAAERYRAWATNQPWARESRLARGRVSDWALNTALWVWNRGRSPGVLEPAMVLREKLGLPVSVFWHWWHGCSYDAGFPEYLPPREGAKSFTNALTRAQAKDIRTLVYMNQRLWGMTTQSWTNEAAARFAVKGPDGQIHPEVYNTFTRQPCATMCMGTAFWRDKYAGLAERAVQELGVNGIYMDQACTSLACFDPQHGHPVGGGVYWMKGFQALQADIRRRCADRREPVVLAGEGCGECWLPYLDLMLGLEISRERYAAPDGWDPLPFWPAVYHPFAITYGNYASLTMPPYDDLWPAESAPAEPLKLLDRKYARQFCLEQARAFVWGQQPTLANFLPNQLTERAEELDFVLRLARLRHRAENYLLRGTFLRPPRLQAPTATLDMSRLSIYAGRGGGLTAFQKTSPLALAAAWRAPDGKVGIALVSIADEPTRVTLHFPADRYGLPRRARVHLLDETGRRQLGTLRQLGSEMEMELPPRAARILELAVP